MGGNDSWASLIFDTTHDKPNYECSINNSNTEWAPALGWEWDGVSREEMWLSLGFLR